ncbi:hypothetical protein LY90DRAFT_673130 [Neocallimastix californiae]|uniref:Uncharacterized protein n=1 Tax=Neocallimastix californiae TaxID=1754190 RepID=A0A1Y2BMU7_9FUNG|nr:hypothetical protein LY90DRAFT_673130 [Neocallimastix californiae]|eukprot:ORY36084.1 hypothetical protein LY90DRAFT_673130 [Neocallimastix californiae]
MCSVNEYSREPYIYVEYWNFLHGIRLFILKNNYYFEDYKSIVESINILTEKILFRVSKLDINYKVKFLIYYSQYCYGITKNLFNSQNNEIQDSINENIGYGSDMIKNLAVGYHIRTVNSLKNLTIELKDLSNTINLNTVTHLNEILTETLKKAENYYSVYINKFPYSKEANNLYSLFMTNIVEKYMKILEEKENEFKEDEENLDPGHNEAVLYENSEGLSSLTGSNGSRRFKVLNNYENRKVYKNFLSGVSGINIAFQSPYIVSRIKYDVRLTSLGLSIDDSEVVNTYMKDLELNTDFLENVYLPLIYLKHSMESIDTYTIKIFNSDLIKEMKNENYFLNIMRIQKNARLYIDECNIFSV